jgi:NitT/TauT family transport system substrate-binding protein
MRAVQYGIPTDKEGIQLRLGVARGLFRDEGLDLSLTVIYGGPEGAAAYDSGALKIGELGSPPAVTALSKGARFRIVGSTIRRHALQYLVVHPSIADWSDLRGKTAAALSIGSCSYWFMREVLGRHGLDPDRDLRIIGMAGRYPEVVDLFETGEVHAAVLSEPNVSIGEDRGVFRILQSLTDPAFCPTMQWGVIVANREAIASEPDLVRAVLRGCVKSYRYAGAHPGELAAFGADYFGIPRETMEKSITREAACLHTDCEVDLAGLQQAVELQVRLRAFSNPMPVEDIVDLQFLPSRQPDSRHAKETDR